MRNKTQYTSLIFPLGLLGILPGWWRRCVEAAKRGYKTPTYIVRSDRAELTLEDVEGVKQGALRLSQTRLARALDASLYTSDLVCDL
jgi:hypothetical protein